MVNFYPPPLKVLLSSQKTFGELKIGEEFCMPMPPPFQSEDGYAASFTKISDSKARELSHGYVFELTVDCPVYPSTQEQQTPQHEHIQHPVS